MRNPKRLGWLVGGGAAGGAGRSRWWGLSSPQWGQWVRRCAAPRQTQWSGLQGRAVCGSRWCTQPMSAFIQPDGSINPIFRTYLVENNEGQLLTRAETMSQRKKRN